MIHRLTPSSANAASVLPLADKVSSKKAVLEFLNMDFSPYSALKRLFFEDSIKMTAPKKYFGILHTFYYLFISSGPGKPRAMLQIGKVTFMLVGFAFKTDSTIGFCRITQFATIIKPLYHIP